MSRHMKVDIGEGRFWYVGSIMSWRAGEVIVPLDQIEGMTDREIGAAVRSLVFDAESCVAMEIADFYVHNGGPRLEEEEDFAENYETLQRHRGEDELIDKAISLIDIALSRQSRRVSRFAAKQPKSRPGYIYVIKAGTHHKIGRSNNVARRMNEFGIQLPYPAEVIFTVAVADMHTTEKLLHQIFADKRLNGEWFDLSDQDLATIRAMFDE